MNRSISLDTSSGHGISGLIELYKAFHKNHSEDSDPPIFLRRNLNKVLAARETQRDLALRGLVAAKKKAVKRLNLTGVVSHKSWTDLEIYGLKHPATKSKMRRERSGSEKVASEQPVSERPTETAEDVENLTWDELVGVNKIKVDESEPLTTWTPVLAEGSESFSRNAIVFTSDRPTDKKTELIAVNGTIGYKKPDSGPIQLGTFKWLFRTKQQRRTIYWLASPISFACCDPIAPNPQTWLRFTLRDSSSHRQEELSCTLKPGMPQTRLSLRVGKDSSLFEASCSVQKQLPPVSVVYTVDKKPVSGVLTGYTCMFSNRTFKTLSELFEYHSLYHTQLRFELWEGFDNNHLTGILSIAVIARATPGPARNSFVHIAPKGGDRLHVVDDENNFPSGIFWGAQYC